MNSKYLLISIIITFLMFGTVSAYCNDADACNDGSSEDCYYWFDCADECGGLDMSCYTQTYGMAGQYDIYEYFFEDASCEGESLLEYQCSIHCENYGTMDECIENCSDGNCEAPYPHYTDSMMAAQLNDDGSVQSLMKLSNEICDDGGGTEFECQNDGDCDFTINYGITGFCGDTGYCYIYLEDTDQSDLFYNYHNWGVDEQNQQLCFSRDTYYECGNDEFFSLEECEVSCDESCEEDRGFIRCYDYSYDNDIGVISTILPGYDGPGDTDCKMNVYTPIDENSNQYGCTDPEACNYDGISIDDCIYPWHNGMCDCDGNYFDCNGECGGNDDSCTIMFQDGPSEIYENSDCSGEAFIEPQGACICPFGSGGCSVFLSEESCLEISGIWFDEDTCVEWTWDYDIDESECVDLGGIWTDEELPQEEDCFFLIETEWENIDECKCGDAGVYEENDYMSNCLQGDLQSDNEWIEIADNLLFDLFQEKTTLYFYENGTVFQTSNSSNCDSEGVCLILIGNYDIDGDLITITESADNNIIEGEITIDNSGEWIGIEFMFPSFNNFNLCLGVIFTSQLGDDLSNYHNIDNYRLQDVYPNPFNPTTTVTYQVPEFANVSIDVYNMNGQLIESLYKGYKNPGEYSINWNAKNITSGAYLIKLVSGSFVETQKVMLIK